MCLIWLTLHAQGWLNSHHENGLQPICIGLVSTRHHASDQYNDHIDYQWERLQLDTADVDRDFGCHGLEPATTINAQRSQDVNRDALETRHTEATLQHSSKSRRWSSNYRLSREDINRHLHRSLQPRMGYCGLTGDRDIRHRSLVPGMFSASESWLTLIISDIFSHLCVECLVVNMFIKRRQNAALCKESYSFKS